MALKPWYKIVTPREDLREGRPLDASEFAVHLDQVRDRRAPADYQEPERFFERTFLTKTLSELAVGVVRRLSGHKVETSAVYNLTTQFGGGKTHALTLLYHLAKGGPAASAWKGVSGILEAAQEKQVPKAATAVLVGTEFDSITGRGGQDGTPLRRTPWGEIAFQLGGKEAFGVVARHEEERTAPSSEVIRQFLPKNRPALILMDELMNYVSRSRKSGLGAQLYNFLHNLSEEVRAHDNVVLAVSIPASELEMTSEDQSDYERFKKVLDRLGKAVIMSAEEETSEIIRRRLFEWGGLPDEARKTSSDYAEWVLAHRTQVPAWFPVDNASEAFSATYPFHPMVLSVFERKWQALPRFQQTRGILRLLALWVSRAYQDGFKGAHKDPLISVGTAPLDYPMFRAAIFEQLGEAKLEGAVTTDVCGKKDSHAVRLDKEAVEAIRKARLHQKVATAIFFESNGGQAKAEASLPEIRLATAEPDLDIGNIETALEELAGTCYFLSSEKSRYRFSLSPNLNKLLSDRRGSVQKARVEERVRAEIQKVFAAGTPDMQKVYGAGAALERIYFPEKSGQIPDRALITLVVLSPDHSVKEKGTHSFVDAATRGHGPSGRTFKSALIWAIPENADALRDEARKVLAWEDIADEQDELRLDDGQKRQLAEQIRKAQRDIKETVWRTYKNLVLLGRDNAWKPVDLGLVNSSQAESMLALILRRLDGDGDVEDGIGPNFLVRNWPPAFTEWSTKSVREAFFSSPQFPRLPNPEVVKDTIARGVSGGIIGYVGKKADGSYAPFYWNTSLPAQDVEISDDVFLIRSEVAESYEAGMGGSSQPTATGHDVGGATTIPLPLGGGPTSPTGIPTDSKTRGTTIHRLAWTGEVPHQKWMNFYTKVLSRFSGGAGLKLTLRVELAPPDGISSQKVEETKVALRELGLKDTLEQE
jgi:uncharacterized protein DUF499